MQAHHTYSLGHMHLFALLVLGAGIGMRGASKAMGIFFSFLGLEIPVPCWTTGRLWLSRLGLRKLSRPKEKAGDWIWIIDHTVRLGAEKCLVILEIRQKKPAEGGTAPQARGRRAYRSDTGEEIQRENRLATA